MDEVKASFKQKGEFSGTTRFYTLSCSEEQRELHFFEISFDYRLDLLHSRVFTRSVLDKSTDLQGTSYSEVTNDELLKLVDKFEEPAWQALAQEFRENCNVGSINFERQYTTAPFHRRWPQLGGAHLAFDDDGLQLSWTHDDLKVKAMLPSIELNGCLDYLGVRSTNELLLTMSSEQDERWADLCRYFESHGTIVAHANKEKD
jgi:hypothetical protein